MTVSTPKPLGEREWLCNCHDKPVVSVNSDEGTGYWICVVTGKSCSGHPSETNEAPVKETWEMESLRKEGYEQGVKEERQRVVEMIEGMKFRETKDSYENGYNSGLSDLQSKLEETI